MTTSSIELYTAFSRRFPEHREELEERAGIMQYDGDLPRAKAESMAVLRLMDKYELWNEIHARRSA